jgi:hypothetical protein
MQKLRSAVTTGRLDAGLDEEGRKNLERTMAQEDRTLSSEQSLLISRSRGKERKPLEEALAEAKGAVAVLDLPMIQNESDFSKYKSGDKVIADDGITVITVP